MKSLLRAIGSLVVVICLAAFVLFKLNEKGFISGALSDWVTSVTNHIVGIKDETKDFLEEEGITIPTARPSQPEQTEVPVTDAPATNESIAPDTADSGEQPVLTSPETQSDPVPNAG